MKYLATLAMVILVVLPSCKKEYITNIINKDTSIIVDTLNLSGMIVIDRPIQLDSTWHLSANTILFFTSYGFIYGKGTIQGGIIDADQTQWLFDTTLTVNPSGTYDGNTYITWWGAKTTNKDNTAYIQKAINMITNNQNTLINLAIPIGSYHYKRPLNIDYIYKGNYVATTIHLFGYSGGAWSSGYGSALFYDSDSGYAINAQLNKGSEFNNFEIIGQFTAPSSSNLTKYYSMPIDSFTDYKCSSEYAGFVIDYDGSLNTSGSTECYLHDMQVSNFVYDYLISPNGKTVNAEAMTLERVRCGNARIGISGSQSQEKDNLIDNVFSWGEIWAVFATDITGKSAGFYNITNGNVAGLPISLLYNQPSGWFATNITDIYCESLGTIGYIGSEIPVLIQGSTFNFADLGQTGNDRSLMYCYNFVRGGGQITFLSDIFRIYNGNYAKDTMNISSNGTFTGCAFWGIVKNTMNATYNYTTEWDNIQL